MGLRVALLAKPNFGLHLPHHGKVVILAGRRERLARVAKGPPSLRDLLGVLTTPMVLPEVCDDWKW